jgi:hypothetical protein
MRRTARGSSWATRACASPQSTTRPRATKRAGGRPQPAGETDVSAGSVARELETRRASGAGDDAAHDARGVANGARRRELGAASVRQAKGAGAYARRLVVNQSRVVLSRAGGRVSDRGSQMVGVGAWHRQRGRPAGKGRSKRR